MNRHEPLLRMFLLPAVFVLLTVWLYPLYANQSATISEPFSLNNGTAYTVSGTVSDPENNPLPNIPIHACDLSKQPVLLISGGEGQDSLIEDLDGLAHIYTWMQNEGYVEGCNLFYASSVSALISREENRVQMQRNMRAAYDRFSSLNPKWHGRFDIIGHSFGGLIARLYLESSYYTADQNYADHGIHIDNLFTLGTPHGGTMVPEEVYPGAMFIIGEHLFNPEDFEEFLAVTQLYSYLMDAYNLSHTQPYGTRYHLIGGDFLLQENVPEAIRILYEPFSEHPGDIGVSLRSAGQLGVNQLLLALYPNVCVYFNEDMHGYSEEFGLGILRSYVRPSTTFDELIKEQIGIRGHTCPNHSTRIAIHDNGRFTYQKPTGPLSSTSKDKTNQVTIHARTGEDGKYNLDLPAGTYAILPIQPGHTFTPSEVVLTLPPGNSSVNFTRQPKEPPTGKSVFWPYILSPRGIAAIWDR